MPRTGTSAGMVLESTRRMRTDPSRELIEQHDALRAIMDDCEQLADDIDAGHGDLARLSREVSKLRVAFEAHNVHEDTVLPTILRGAVGDVRFLYMVADHLEEHRALRASLDGPPADLRATLYSLRAHLAGEERMFAAAGALRADAVTLS